MHKNSGAAGGACGAWSAGGAEDGGAGDDGDGGLTRLLNLIASFNKL